MALHSVLKEVLFVMVMNVRKNRIAELRAQKNMSQAKLANELGVGTQTISNWENGRRTPDIGALYKLSEILDASIDDILGNNPKGKKSIIGKITEPWEEVFALIKEIKETRSITAQRIKELRLNNGISETAMAQLLNNSDYEKIENGETGARLIELIKIAELYNVSLDYLAGRTDNPAGMYAGEPKQGDIGQRLFILEETIREMRGKDE
jgi:transcriptional regulator with XRE-family HTH domain